MAFQYWSIYIPLNSVSPWLGEVLLVSFLRAFVRPMEFGVERTVSRGYIPALETEYGVKTYYDMNVKNWRFSGKINGNEADRNAMLELLDSCHGPVYPFLFILDDRDQTDGGYYVRFTEDTVKAWTHKRIGAGTYDMPFTVEEISRGLPMMPLNP